MSYSDMESTVRHYVGHNRSVDTDVVVSRTQCYWHGPHGNELSGAVPSHPSTDATICNALIDSYRDSSDQSTPDVFAKLITSPFPPSDALLRGICTRAWGTGKVVGHNYAWEYKCDTATGGVVKYTTAFGVVVRMAFNLPFNTAVLEFSDPHNNDVCCIVRYNEQDAQHPFVTYESDYPQTCPSRNHMFRTAKSQMGPVPGDELKPIESMFRKLRAVVRTLPSCAPEIVGIDSTVVAVRMRGGKKTVLATDVFDHLIRSGPAPCAAFLNQLIGGHIQIVNGEETKIWSAFNGAGKGLAMTWSLGNIDASYTHSRIGDFKGVLVAVNIGDQRMSFTFRSAIGGSFITPDVCLCPCDESANALSLSIKKLFSSIPAQLKQTPYQVAAAVMYRSAVRSLWLYASAKRNENC